MATEHTGPVEVEGKGLFGQDGLWNTAYGYKVICKYAEGFTLVVADTDKLVQGIRFIGTDGWAHIRRNGIYTNPESLAGSVIGPNEIHLYKSDDHKGNFIDCVYSRTETIAPAESAHRSVAIGHLGTIAMKVGRKLRWDPVAEKFLDGCEANSLLSRPMRSPWRL